MSFSLSMASGKRCGLARGLYTRGDSRQGNGRAGGRRAACNGQQTGNGEAERRDRPDDKLPPYSKGDYRLGGERASPSPQPAATTQPGSELIRSDGWSAWASCYPVAQPRSPDPLPASRYPPASTRLISAPANIASHPSTPPHLISPSDGRPSYPFLPSRLPLPRFRILPTSLRAADPFTFPSSRAFRNPPFAFACASPAPTRTPLPPTPPPPPLTLFLPFFPSVHML